MVFIPSGSTPPELLYIEAVVCYKADKICHMCAEFGAEQHTLLGKYDATISSVCQLAHIIYCLFRQANTIMSAFRSLNCLLIYQVLDWVMFCFCGLSRMTSQVVYWAGVLGLDLFCFFEEMFFFQSLIFEF